MSFVNNFHGKFLRFIHSRKHHLIFSVGMHSQPNSKILKSFRLQPCTGTVLSINRENSCLSERLHWYRWKQWSVKLYNFQVTFTKGEGASFWLEITFRWHLWKAGSRGFVKGQAPGKLTGCEQDLAMTLPGCFLLLYLLPFIRKTKNARLKNPTDLLHKNLMKPLWKVWKGYHSSEKVLE